MIYKSSPETLWVSLSPAKLDDIAVSPTRGISGIIKDLGREKGVVYINALLTYAIIELAKFFNVQNNFNAEQVTLTANLVREKYYWLKPDDFKLCFKNVMKGNYGKVYNRIDGAMIMEWLDMYIEERLIFFEAKSEHGHFRNKEVRDTTVSTKDQEFHAVKMEQFRKDARSGNA